MQKGPREAASMPHVIVPIFAYVLFWAHGTSRSCRQRPTLILHCPQPCLVAWDEYFLCLFHQAFSSWKMLMNFPSSFEPWAAEGSLAHREILVRVWYLVRWNWSQMSYTQRKLCFLSPSWDKLAGETGSSVASSVTPLDEASRLHPGFEWILTHNYPGIGNKDQSTGEVNLQQKIINLEERTSQLWEL